MGTSHRFRHIAKETEELSDDEEGEDAEEALEADEFLNGLDEEMRLTDTREGSSEGEGRKRKRAEDFGESPTAPNYLAVADEVGK